MIINPWIWLPSVSFFNRMWSRPYWTVIPVIERRHIIWLPRPLRWINVTQMRKNVTLKIETLFFRIENELDEWEAGSELERFFLLWDPDIPLAPDGRGGWRGKERGFVKDLRWNSDWRKPQDISIFETRWFQRFPRWCQAFRYRPLRLLTKRPRATEKEFNQQSNTIWNSVRLADAEMGIVSSKHLCIGALVRL